MTKAFLLLFSLFPIQPFDFFSNHVCYTYHSREQNNLTAYTCTVWGKSIRPSSAHTIENAIQVLLVFTLQKCFYCSLQWVACLVLHLMIFADFLHFLKKSWTKMTGFWNSLDIGCLDKG